MRTSPRLLFTGAALFAAVVLGCPSAGWSQMPSDLTSDGSNRISRVDFDHATSDVDDRYLTFSYTSVSYTDEGGNAVTRDRLASVTQQPLNETVVSYEYDSNGLLWKVKNRFGEVLEEYVNDLPAQPGYTKRVIHEIKARDADGSLQTVRKYYYGQQRHLTKVFDGAGAEIFHLDTDYGYMSTAIMRDGIKYASLHDNLRNTTEVQVLSATDELIEKQTQTFTSDALYGNTSHLPLTKVDASGSTTTYEYVNPSGTLGERMHVKTITHADGTTETFGYNSDWHLTEHNLPMGRTSRYGYDSEGNRSWSQDPAGNYTFYTFDSYGRLTQVEDATSATVQYAYNTKGQVTTTTDTEGRATTNEYDSRDLLTTVTALGVQTLYAYDSRDRLTTTTDHLGNTTVYTYDGLDRKIATTDPLNNTTRYVFDTTGTLRNKIFADSTMTTSTYDFYGRLTQWTNPRGNSWSYAYDALGRLTTETTPLSKTKIYSYVSAAGSGCGCAGAGLGVGKPYSIKDYAGNYTYFEYDSMGRLKKKTFSGTADYVENTYDDAGRRTDMLDTRLPSADLGGQTFSWAYDLNDRVTTETYPDGSTIGRAFDALGRRTSMTDPDGNTSTYSYANTSNNKKLSSITHGLLGTSSFSYFSSDGTLEYVYHANSVVDVYSYDSMKRLSQIQVYSDPTSVYLHNEDYTYNAASIPTRVDMDRYVSGSREYSYRLYGYDSQLRLKSEDRWTLGGSRDWGRWYTYDDGGNRTQMSVWNGSTTATTSYTYNAGDQLSERADPLTLAYPYTYDANGNLYSIDYHTEEVYYSHNRWNRLETYFDGYTTEVWYTYDDLGRRIMRMGPNGTTKYYYDGLNVLMTKEKPSGGSWRTKKVYMLKEADLGAIVSEREMTAWNGSHQPTSWTDHWFHCDRLGNVLLLTDSASGIVAQYEQEAFGNVITGSQAGHHLTTKEYDSDAGLYYFWQRWLSASTGLFVQVAPLRPADESLYSFAAQNPLVYVDPAGRYPDYYIPYNYAGDPGPQDPDWPGCVNRCLQAWFDSVPWYGTVAMTCTGRAGAGVGIGWVVLGPCVCFDQCNKCSANYVPW